MEVLVPESCKGEYLLWQVSYDDIKVVTQRVKQVVDSHKGKASLEIQQRNIETSLAGYNKLWVDFSKVIVKGQVSLKLFLKEHVSLKGALTLASETAAEAIDSQSQMLTVIILHLAYSLSYLILRFQDFPDT